MLAELRVTPIESNYDFSRLLAGVLQVVHESGVSYQVTAMSTVMEGPLSLILDIVRRCHEEARKHVDRVLIELVLDDRAGHAGELAMSPEHLREAAGELPLERVTSEPG
jgi:uncharacterized protein YqgV (UPF0045/DUF77 family)